MKLTDHHLECNDVKLVEIQKSTSKIVDRKIHKKDREHHINMDVASSEEFRVQKSGRSLTRQSESRRVLLSRKR